MAKSKAEKTPELKMTGAQLADFYADLCKNYPLITIEEPSRLARLQYVAAKQSLNSQENLLRVTRGIRAPQQDHARTCGY